MRKVLILLVLAACGPMTVAQAERQCYERARLTEHPTGSVSVGVGSGGRTAAGLELNVSTDYLMGRDPGQIYDNCVVNKSGQMPSRPYSSLTAAPK